MPKRTTSYRDRLLQRLSSPEEAANYLNAAMDDSMEVFLEALRDVAQARQMSVVASQAGVQRETIYRAFSKTGNPTLDTLNSVLGVCGLQLDIAARGKRSPTPASGAPVRQSRYSRAKNRRAVRTRIMREGADQLSLFADPASVGNVSASEIGYSSVESPSVSYVGVGAPQSTMGRYVNQMYQEQKEEVPLHLLVAASTGAISNEHI